MSEMDAACGEIARSLLQGGEPTAARARAEIKRICAKYSLERIPKNHEILGRASGKDFELLRRALMKKPAKTASGVAVVALMPRPFACPHGRCTYCPGGIESNTPNSYTGSEPATISAIEHGYEPGAQITTKLQRLVANGHDVSKTELVIVGGTFLFMPQDYRERFIASCYDALTGRVSATLEEAKAANETAAVRSVGLTIETKPDYCKAPHVDDMLRYGATRVEIGVQSLDERAYGIVNRGHTLADVHEAFQAARDAGYKIAAHMMPGLPGATPESDVDGIRRLFEDARLRPDMLKIYPALVIRGTGLYEDYAAGRYRPYSDEQMIGVLAEAKALVPSWARIMRVQREISGEQIVAGPRSGNLRQLAVQEMRRRGLSCRCIRCREPGAGGTAGSPRLCRSDYEASGGREVFLSYEDGGVIHGFLRLRMPGPGAHRPEMPGSAVVRELHVYGPVQGLGQRGGIQHSGLGRSLMAEAERIARGELGADRLLVISAVGTRQYYARLGYGLQGPYMAKGLAGA